MTDRSDSKPPDRSNELFEVANRALVLARSAWICRRCGYELSGLKRTDNCPECSQPVAWSLGDEENRLVHADPAFVRQLARFLAVILVLLTVGTVVAFSGALGSTLVWKRLLGPRGAYAGLTIGTIVLLSCLVVTMMTIAPRDPGAKEREKKLQRRCERNTWLSLVFVGVTLASMWLGPPSGWSGIVKWSHVELVSLVVAAWFSLDLVHGLAEYLASIADRIPCDISRRSKVASMLGYVPWVVVVRLFIKDPSVTFAVNATAMLAIATALALSALNVQTMRRGVGRVVVAQAERVNRPDSSDGQ